MLNLNIKNGLFKFVHVKGYVAGDNEPELSITEKEEIKKLGEKYNAQCFFAKVGFGSCDPDRFEARLALEGDGFYCKYEGLQEIR